MQSVKFNSGSLIRIRQQPRTHLSGKIFQLCLSHLAILDRSVEKHQRVVDYLLLPLKLNI
jgi:hypothetical protein